MNLFSHPQNPNFFFHSPPLTTNLSPNLPTPPAPPVPDLSAALSSLKALISHTHQTLDSFSKILSLNPHSLLRKPGNDNLVACPVNPHHLMPTESLFLHSLHCPSPLDLTPLVASLHYPSSFKSSSELQHETHFIQSLENAGDSELCFSLDDYVNFGTNFFYKDCPGVVNFYEVDGIRRTFQLPRVLSVECANFVGFGEKEVKKGFDIEGFSVLPSDYWAIRNEIDSWADYPYTCSFNVLCAFLGLKMVDEGDMRKWLIANSPRYGVIIDVYMRDHMSVLFRLCLRAIVREAFGLVESALKGGELKGKEPEMNLKCKRLNCPVLVQVLTWFVSKLSVLYGDINGKFFAIDILRQCITESASRLLLFPLEKQVIDIHKSTEGSERLKNNGIQIEDMKPEEPLEKGGKCELKNRMEGSVVKGVVFVSQVAAAIAALHERSLLEEKIRELRFSQPVTRYQRMTEHDILSKRAEEERINRSNYKAIIGHDGLPRQQTSNQETKRTKTREELLAEERDYKRRRMSYRGKKVKRTTLQVMRDIIEEYMEEIKQAGGIGCFEK
ncbi:U11/U12 small nuclear ribonucleoprotein 48 kDa protein [Carica papaya]|uniref:U11/U12 small nuclear ribonucleoprotein 48 kDa protein n=1 Tax=Carica papaya TaxID=3649 RepID=UPI000B8C9ECF|nr:U11/U12 small nuclear ribonucleoprotein 48 kDa protein [Carica papaya]